MATLLLLVIIYISFISLGLPDALVGVSWPSIRLEWGLPLDAAGLISTVVTLGTISSSLLSGKLIRRFGAAKITLFSGILTGGATLGYGFAPHYAWFVVLALPLGFGAGSVDTALNHYVASRFKAHHMNWLHSFWGLGATGGPLIMSALMTKTNTWRTGFVVVGIIQLILAVFVWISLPLWRVGNTEKTSDTDSSEEKNRQRPKGVYHAMSVFLVYCAAEYAVGLWSSSYLIQTKGLSVERAASWVALYYAGITLGRIASGFISFKLSNRQMIKLGILLSGAGTLLIGLTQLPVATPAGLLIVGLGFAPIFPSMVHETPKRFGEEQAQSIIGYQMASAYVGIAIFPPLLGIVIERTHMMALPLFVASCVLMMYILTQRLNVLTPLKEN